MKKRSVIGIVVIAVLLIASATVYAAVWGGWVMFLKETIRSRNLERLYDRTPRSVELQDYLNERNLQLSESEADAAYYLNEGSVYPLDIDGDGKEELWQLNNSGSQGNYTTVLLKEAGGRYTLYGTTSGYILPVKYRGTYHFVGLERDYDTKFLKTASEYALEGSSLVIKKTYGLAYSYEAGSLPKEISDFVDSGFFNSLLSYQFSGSDAVTVQSRPGFPAFQISLDDQQNQHRFRFDYALEMTSVGYSPSRWSLEASDNFTYTFPGIETLTTDFDTDPGVLLGIRFFKGKDGAVDLLRVSYPYFTNEPHRNGVLDVQLFRFGKDSVEEVERLTLNPTVKLSREDTAAGGGDAEPADGGAIPSTGPAN